MYFVGLDLSITSSGYSIFDEDGDLLAADVVLSKADGIEDIPRFDKIADLLARKIRLHTGMKMPSIYYVLEDYAFRSKGQITRIAENTGIIKHRLFTEFNALPNVCSVLTLKKFAVGYKPGKGKGPVMVGVYKKWGFETKSDDIADAYALGRLAKELYYWTIHKKSRNELFKYEKEAIETVRKRNKYLKK